MYERVRVTELKLGDRFSFSTKPTLFVVTDLHSNDKNGPAIEYSTIDGRGRYKLTVMNPSITVKKHERI